jgi:hypothetical protein
MRAEQALVEAAGVAGGFQLQLPLHMLAIHRAHLYIGQQGQQQRRQQGREQEQGENTPCHPAAQEQAVDRELEQGQHVAHRWPQRV